MPDRNKQVEVNEAKLVEEGYIRPATGDPAPAFHLVDTNGTGYSVGDNAEIGLVVIFFSTAAEVPNATKNLRSLDGFKADLDAAGITALAVVPGTPDEVSRYAGQLGLSIPVLTDKDLKVAQAYGCAIEGATLAQRTTVGIGKDGKVAFFERGYPFTSAKQIIDRFDSAPQDK